MDSNVRKFGSPYGPREMPYLVTDRRTGEIVGATSECVISPRDAQNAKQRRLIEAFWTWGEAAGTTLTLWTLGTAETEVEPICDYAQKLGKLLGGHKWIMVLEAGSKGGRWHIHMLLEGEYPWAEMRALWSGITGHPKPHVLVGRAYSTGVGSYLAKYLSKDGEGKRTGHRLLRSSKGLRALLATYLPPPPKRRMVTMTYLRLPAPPDQAA